MDITLILSHFILAIILFFLFNWVGSKSFPLGYTNFSIFDSREESVSLNIVLKIFGPIVFLIITSGFFEYINIEQYNHNIFEVIIFYVILRIIAIFIYERQTIANWWIILPQHITLIIISYFIYDRFINNINQILPDFTDIKNEIWLIIIVFIYTVFNNPRAKSDELEYSFTKQIKPRKKSYVLKRYDYFKSKFSDEVDKHSPNNESFKLLIYALIIYENFNRPKIIRKLENFWCFLSNKEITQGILQVKSKKVISNDESLKIGITNLRRVRDYIIYNNEYFSDFENYAKLVKSHCPDREYINEVFYLVKTILENKFTYKEIKLSYNTLYQQTLENLGIHNDFIEQYSLENDFDYQDIILKLEENLKELKKEDDSESEYKKERRIEITKLINEYETVVNNGS